MSSNEEIFNNFMDSVDLYKTKIGVDLLVPHKHKISTRTPINLINGDTGVCLDYGSLNKQTFIKFASFDTPDIIVRCNLCNILPAWNKSNKLDLKFNNEEEQYLCNLFLSFLIRSHISNIFEETELQGYKKDKINKKKDIFLPEKIAGLEAIKAIRNRNKKKFNKNFKNWKKFVMEAQEEVEETIMDGDLYSEEKSTIGYYGDDIEVNEEAYRKICDINKDMFNEFTAINMIAEKINWW